MYSVDFSDIVAKLLPIELRKDWLKRYIKAALQPLQNINTYFFQLVNDTDYKLAFNGQVIYLEHILNDRYDPINRGIYIEDGANVVYTYIYNVLETKPPLFIYNKSEGNPTYLKNRTEHTTTVQFIIKVPLAVSYDEYIMRLLVDTYKQAGVIYSIETY